jgi:hypothetical protein
VAFAVGLVAQLTDVFAVRRYAAFGNYMKTGHQSSNEAGVSCLYCVRSEKSSKEIKNKHTEEVFAAITKRASVHEPEVIDDWDDDKHDDDDDQSGFLQSIQNSEHILGDPSSPTPLWLGLLG